MSSNVELFLTTTDLAIVIAVIARLCESSALKPEELVPVGGVHDKCTRLLKEAQRRADESKRKVEESKHASKLRTVPVVDESKE